MNKELERLLTRLRQRIHALNRDRLQDGLPPLARLTVKLLGQFALRVHPVASKQLHLTQTMDVDALVESDASGLSVLKEELYELGLQYDELSSEIWIPPGSAFEILVDEPEIEIAVLEPIAVLTSKALKAPEKNRALIIEGLAVFGHRLAEAIIRHGGNPRSFFRSE